MAEAASARMQTGQWRSRDVGIAKHRSTQERPEKTAKKSHTNGRARSPLWCAARRRLASFRELFGLRTTDMLLNLAAGEPNAPLGFSILELF
ncbi:MAG: hypothetical protein A3B37_03690 [Candidatus Sungbacteria bacterium RIFCSPLOWO2_01_FULL_59_16]|uniref:Uncharacterized protein n=1 Tax=Candidatus Sungbacteria bacterium RIFCSPLOWO2_01_FULL_59_16 TaxID=1802280 RepID=A0A1G2L9V1_9BACT|nr:MAG: hypothetical protein A3B37_03690 [Candidatus Sungbacteria bacterium RIFCSPLOWO2_01_FULL_59_16]